MEVSKTALRRLPRRYHNLSVAARHSNGPAAAVVCSPMAVWSRRQFITTSGRSLPGPSGLSLGGSSSAPTYFQRHTSLPANTIIRFVPQQTAWIVERMGKFNRILQPGLAILMPVIDVCISRSVYRFPDLIYLSAYRLRPIPQRIGDRDPQPKCNHRRQCNSGIGRRVIYKSI